MITEDYGFKKVFASARSPRRAKEIEAVAKTKNTLSRDLESCSRVLARCVCLRKVHEKIVNRSVGEHSIVVHKKKVAQLVRAKAVPEES